MELSEKDKIQPPNVSSLQGTQNGFLQGDRFTEKKSCLPCVHQVFTEILVVAEEWPVYKLWSSYSCELEKPKFWASLGAYSCSANTQDREAEGSAGIRGHTTEWDTVSK